MGYVYYGNYALYYEVGRVELLRSLGITYADLERQGIGLPVLLFNIKYVKPARYDDLLSLKTTLIEMPSSRITFEYECRDVNDYVLNIGTVTLAFIDIKLGKPIRCPENLERILKGFFP